MTEAARSANRSERSPRVAQPRTEAGRQMLDALPLDEWHPMNREFAREQQMAYWHAHAEAIVAALRTATPPAESPPAESEPIAERGGSLEAGKSDGD